MTEVKHGGSGRKNTGEREGKAFRCGGLRATCLFYEDEREWETVHFIDIHVKI